MIINSLIAGGVRKAEGTATVTEGASKTFTRYDGNTSNSNYVTVNSDFGFVPSLIIVSFSGDGSSDYTTIYKKDSWTTNESNVIKTGDNYYFRLTGNAKVSKTGFTLPFSYYDGTVTCTWVAFE